jgi:hypothetical protein
MRSRHSTKEDTEIEPHFPIKENIDHSQIFKNVLAVVAGVYYKITKYLFLCLKFFKKGNSSISKIYERLPLLEQ